MQQIINIATNEGDIVMDCFLGSGSTISAAHKLNRKYIGIEKGNHIVDLVVERMKLVVQGEKGGISKSINWKGGGNFSFYNLELIEGNISTLPNATMNVFEVVKL